MAYTVLFPTDADSRSVALCLGFGEYISLTESDGPIPPLVNCLLLALLIVRSVSGRNPAVLVLALQRGSTKPHCLNLKDLYKTSRMYSSLLSLFFSTMLIR